MSCILHIETSTTVCSVALSEDGQCIYHDEDRSGQNHNERIGTFVDAALSFADSHAIPLDAVAVSMAKGICYALNLPLVAVPTLELLAVPVLLRHDDLPADALLCPMIDARRMEVYSALYDRALHTVREIRAEVVEPGAYDEMLARHPVYFFGDGAEKCKSVINHPNAHFIDNIQPLAKNMSPLAEKRLITRQTEDVAYFEPFYLKDFVAIKPRKTL